MDLTDIAIDTTAITTAYDHDGNVHTKDIGQDYLLDLFDDMETVDDFTQQVYSFREGGDIPDVYDDEAYSEGEELGILIADSGLRRDDIIDQVDGNGFRDGFPTFLRDTIEAGSTAFIVSAGDEDFLREFYRDHAFDLNRDNLAISGTKQDWQDGESRGIRRGCGRDKKHQRYFEQAAIEHLNGRPYDSHPYDPLVASGDSPGDEKLLGYARETGGLAIATGERPEDYADIVIEDDSWYGQIAATLGFAGLQNGLDRDDIVDEAASYLQQFDIDDEPDIRMGGTGDRTAALNDTYHDIHIGETITDLTEDILDAAT